MHSCGVFIYNYRCSMDGNYSIPNPSADTSLRHDVGKFIMELSGKYRFYHRFASATYDSLYLYGPDYHKFTFKVRDMNQTTDIQLHYFGYNGSRRRPPQKEFIQSLNDSLKSKYGATVTILTNYNNERIKVNQ